LWTRASGTGTGCMERPGKQRSRRATRILQALPAEWPGAGRPIQPYHGNSGDGRMSSPALAVGPVKPALRKESGPAKRCHAGPVAFATIYYDLLQGNDPIVRPLGPSRLNL